MTRALILAAMIAAPAYAQDTAAWGTTTVTLAPADAPAVATVTLRNTLQAVASLTRAVLILDGIEVAVLVEHMPGDTPDRMTVTPPDGFVAVPPSLDVPEGETGVVVIYEWAGM